MIFQSCKNRHLNSAEHGNTIFHSRSNDEGYANGALSDDIYERGQKRSLVSLKVCMITWAIEVFSSLVFVAIPSFDSFQLKYVKIRIFHHIDCIITLIIIPAVYIINDEETRGVIAEEGWYQGFRHILGMHNQIIPASTPPAPRRNQNT